MERRPRRYVPGSDDLEPRALLSAASPQAEVSTTAAATRKAAATPAPKVTASQASNATTATLEQKQQRIDRLPFFLNSILPNRPLPPSVVARLQGELRTIIGQLRRPPSSALESFNIQLRRAFGNQTISVSAARSLNNAFGGVLKAAGATTEATQSLKAAMNELAMVDVESPQPTLLLANDYALVLQTALGVGQPIQGVPANPTPRNPTAPRR